MVAYQHISLWKFKPGTEQDARRECLQKLKKVSKPGVLRINVGERIEGSETEWGVGLTAELQGVATAPALLEELINVAKDLPLEHHTHMAIQCLAAPAIRAPAQQTATSAKRNFRAMGLPFMPAAKTQRPAIPKDANDETAADSKADDKQDGDEVPAKKSLEEGERDISKQIYVSGLPYRANNEDIWSFFKDKGFNVARVHIFRTPMGKSKGFSLAKQKGIKNLRGIESDGKIKGKFFRALEDQFANLLDLFGGFCLCAHLLFEI